MSAATTGRDVVGISLIAGPDAEAAVKYARETYPDVSVSDRASFYKIERAGELGFDMTEISARAGRIIDSDIFLVSMSSYYGRIDVSGDRVDIFSQIKPTRFAD